MQLKKQVKIWYF